MVKLFQSTVENRSFDESEMLSNRSRGERAPRPPPSREVEYKLINDTVNDICTTIKKYAQKYFTKKQPDYFSCASCFRQVLQQWKIESPSSVSWKDFSEKVGHNNIDKNLKASSGYADLLFICERSRDFETMIPHVRENLVTCVKEHVYKYCQSFAEETGGIDARVVLDYEDQIRNYKREINDKITSINADILRYSEVKSPLDKFISDGHSVATLMESICVQIVEVSHEVKKWTCDDATFPDKLLQEIVFNNGYRDTLHDDVVKLQRRRSSLERSIERRKRINKKVERDYLLHRKEKRRRKDSLKTVRGKVERLEFQVAQKDESIEGTKTALSTRRMISPRQEEDMHIALAKHIKEVDRLNEWLTVMRRQKYRLERELKEISDRTYELKVESITNTHEHEEMDRTLDGMGIELKSLQERFDTLDRKTEIMKHIRVLKMSPETLRRLYRRRREFYQQGQLMDACRFVAQEIAAEWKRLYECLPFEPKRDNNKLSHDIELIDLISARNDRTPEEQALKCLDKWRTFNRKHADVAQLIRGLRKLNKLDLADKVELRFSIEDVYG